MAKSGRGQWRLGRPQLSVLLLVVGLLVWGGLWPRFSVQAGMQARPAVQALSAYRTPAVPVAGPSCAEKPCLALTFDDGPDAVVTPAVLDILDRHRARATFFVVGAHIQGNEALLRRMHQSGHEIGNHSWGHDDMTILTADQIHRQLYDTQAVVAAAGVPAPRLFRPPYGAVNPYVDSQVPLTIVQWNIDPEDWRSKKPPQHIVEHMGAHAKPGGVVVMHDTQVRTVEALALMLTQLERTYQFVTVSELFHLAPGQAGIFYGQ